MLKRHEVQALLKPGHSQVEVARLAGVSLSSVKRISEEATVVEVQDEASASDAASAGRAGWSACAASSKGFCERSRSYPRSSLKCYDLI